MNANHTLDLVRDALYHPENRAYRTFHTLALVQDREGFDLALDYACGADWGETGGKAFADRERLRGLLELCKVMDVALGVPHEFNAARLGVSAESVLRARRLILELRSITRTARERRAAYLARAADLRPGDSVWIYGDNTPPSPHQHPTVEPYLEWTNLRYGLNVYRFWGGWVAEILLPENGPATLRLLGPDERGPDHPLTSDYDRFRREWPDEQPERVALWLEQGDRARELLGGTAPAHP